MQPQPAAAPLAAPSTRTGAGWAWIAASLVIVAAGSVQLLARLGHYALWDDEAQTALLAQAVYRTGDTSAILGHNIIAYRAGAHLREMADRFNPPLASYLAAPFVGRDGRSAQRARLPFALCGVASLLLIALWLRRLRHDPLSLTLAAIAVLGNVSLFLYFRQARHYAPALLLTLAMAYLYTSQRPGRGRIALFTLCSVLLLATNYINFAAAWVGIAADYALWYRRAHRLGAGDFTILIVPHALAAILLLGLWNPFLTSGAPEYFQLSPVDKVHLLGRFLRDMSVAEFGVMWLVAVAPLLYLHVKNPWLLRLPLLIALYIVTTVLVSHQPVVATTRADVRYVVPAIPLLVACSVMCLRYLLSGAPVPTVAAGVVAFGSNVLHVVPLLERVPLRSTALLFVRELINPPGDPYSVAAAWIRWNIAPNASIWVRPQYMTYPLMYHAPQALYAWQLDDPPAEQFRALPAIHFAGRVAPDYIVAFGPPGPEPFTQLRLRDRSLVHYEQFAVLDHYWRDVHRPELFWRSFVPVTQFDRASEAIYILRRSTAAATRSADKPPARAQQIAPTTK